ncbi:penicillin-binding protein [Sesbania bispinosa]|nr:penicillin-binding protein [Sesbania bispinosa]
MGFEEDQTSEYLQVIQKRKIEEDVRFYRYSRIEGQGSLKDLENTSEEGKYTRGKSRFEEIVNGSYWKPIVKDGCQNYSGAFAKVQKLGFFKNIV